MFKMYDQFVAAAWSTSVRFADLQLQPTKPWSLNVQHLGASATLLLPWFLSASVQAAAQLQHF
jgi:hypothetical protein